MGNHPALIEFALPERFPIDTLLRAFEPVIEQLPDHHTGRNTTYTLSDAVPPSAPPLRGQGVSTFAVFPRPTAVVQRQQGRNNAPTLYGVAQIPSDNQIHNLPDPLSSERLFPLFDTCWQILWTTPVNVVQFKYG